MTSDNGYFENANRQRVFYVVIYYKNKRGDIVQFNSETKIGIWVDKQTGKMLEGTLPHKRLEDDFKEFETYDNDNCS